jgi:hypothetical protein
MFAKSNSSKLLLGAEWQRTDAEENGPAVLMLQGRLVQ